MSTELLTILLAAGVIVFVVTTVAVTTRGSTLRDVEMRFSSPLPPTELRDRALNDLLALVAREDYALVSADDGRLTFERRHRPAWTIYLAALTWPGGPLLWLVGLLALRRRKTIAVTLTAAPAADGGSALLAAGTMTRRLQDAFRGFFASSA